MGNYINNKVILKYLENSNMVISNNKLTITTSSIDLTQVGDLYKTFGFNIFRLLGIKTINVRYQGNRRGHNSHPLMLGYYTFDDNYNLIKITDNGKYKIIPTIINKSYDELNRVVFQRGLTEEYSDCLEYAGETTTILKVKYKDLTKNIWYYTTEWDSIFLNQILRKHKDVKWQFMQLNEFKEKGLETYEHPLYTSNL